MAGKPKAVKSAKRSVRTTPAKGRPKTPTQVKDAGRQRGPKEPAAPIRGAVLGQAKAVDLPPPEFPDVADPKKRAYVVALALSGKYDEAARAAGVCLRTGWNWREDKSDEAFQQALGLAFTLACDRIEAEIHRRAYEGVEEPVFQGGRLVGTVRKFSDTLLIFKAKAMMPKYRDRSAVEHSGAIDLTSSAAKVDALLADLTAPTTEGES